MFLLFAVSFPVQEKDAASIRTRGKRKAFFNRFLSEIKRRSWHKSGSAFFKTPKTKS
jgi:hypothetical protein